MRDRSGRECDTGFSFDAVAHDRAGQGRIEIDDERARRARSTRGLGLDRMMGNGHESGRRVEYRVLEQRAAPSHARHLEVAGGAVRIHG